LQTIEFISKHSLNSNGRKKPKMIKTLLARVSSKHPRIVDLKRTQ